MAKATFHIPRDLYEKMPPRRLVIYTAMDLNTETSAIILLVRMSLTEAVTIPLASKDEAEQVIKSIQKGIKELWEDGEDNA